MNISPDEAQEALADIQKMTLRTRHSVAGSGAHIFLIATGVVWLVGFLSTQFLSGAIVAYIWVGMSLLASVLAAFYGNRMNRRVRSPSAGPLPGVPPFFGDCWLSTPLPLSRSPALAMEGKLPCWSSCSP
jgi:hypothetical protein